MPTRETLGGEEGLSGRALTQECDRPRGAGWGACRQSEQAGRG